MDCSSNRGWSDKAARSNLESAIPFFCHESFCRLALRMGEYAAITPQSLSENYKGCCGEGFWLWPRRRGRRIPAAGCNDRANAGQRQKTRRPEGFRAEGRLASLLLSRRPTRGMGFPSPASQIPKTEGCAIAQCSLLRRASPSGLLRENSTPWNFQTGSEGIQPEISLLPLMGWPVTRSGSPRSADF